MKETQTNTKAQPWTIIRVAGPWLTNLINPFMLLLRCGAHGGKSKDFEVMMTSISLHFLPIISKWVAELVKNLPANAGDARDTGLIPVLRRSPRTGNGNPLQYSCLGNPMDRGAWQTTVHGVAKSQTQPSNTCTALGEWLKLFVPRLAHQ